MQSFVEIFSKQNTPTMYKINLKNLKNYMTLIEVIETELAMSLIFSKKPFPSYLLYCFITSVPETDDKATIRISSLFGAETPAQHTARCLKN